jgi:phosphohistidine phosphatase
LVLKTLYLIRHAKSSWNNASLSDYDRPLNERGKRDVVTMGSVLNQKGVLPDCIIASAAKRTRKTAKKIAKGVGFNESEIKFEKELYHSGIIDLLKFTNNISDEYLSAFIIVHNPGVSAFCDYLTHYTVDFPTCGIAKITFDIDSWAEVSNGLGDLEWFDYPKKHQG